MHTRPAQVRGRFYPGSPREIERQLAVCLGEPRAEQPALALVLPHAGWVYSGAIAGEAIAQTRIPERVIVLCPNHTGQGARGAVWARGEWECGIDRVPIDEALADSLLARTSVLQADDSAHFGEHAIEVLLPLLQARQPALRVVPICLGPLRYEQSAEVGAAMASVIAQLPEAERPLIVASTDMSHFLSAEQAQRADAPALDAVLHLDPRALYQRVVEQDISMCGFLPTCATLCAVRELGASRAELMKYGHSGLVTGDDSRVVAYASFRLS
ncbi:MAG: AmmeMemoRadiSam system protein B [Polyangiaceae bacterium]|nr:AmmeMemoRadiSam system protein B [Polyangiaceae bacterium]MCB9609541.1 AmmeMemoRadiSam system protein B [Polyangiaceae bacterium]